MNMKNLFAALLLVFMAGGPVLAAAEKGVLLPISGPLTAEEKKGLADTVAGHLSGSYQVVYGEEVNDYITKVFREESKKDDCDEEACYRKIATHYGAETIFALRVVKEGDALYVVTFNIYDVLTEKVVQSRKEACSHCSYESLNEISGRLVLVEK